MHLFASENFKKNILHFILYYYFWTLLENSTIWITLWPWFTASASCWVYRRSLLQTQYAWYFWEKKLLIVIVTQTLYTKMSVLCIHVQCTYFNIINNFVPTPLFPKKEDICLKEIRLIHLVKEMEPLLTYLQGRNGQASLTHKCSRLIPQSVLGETSS